MVFRVISLIGWVFVPVPLITTVISGRLLRRYFQNLLPSQATEVLPLCWEFSKLS